MTGRSSTSPPGYDMLCLMDSDVREGAAALSQKRQPKFVSAH